MCINLCLIQVIVCLLSVYLLQLLPRGLDLHFDVFYSYERKAHTLIQFVQYYQLHFHFYSSPFYWFSLFVCVFFSFTGSVYGGLQFVSGPIVVRYHVLHVFSQLEISQTPIICYLIRAKQIHLRNIMSPCSFPLEV